MFEKKKMQNQRVVNMCEFPVVGCWRAFPWGLAETAQPQQRVSEWALSISALSISLCLCPSLSLPLMHAVPSKQAPFKATVVKIFS